MTRMAKMEHLIRSVYSDSLTARVPLAHYSSWKMGGSADFMAVPDSERELQKLLHILNTESIPWLLVGNGTNILFSDTGFRGVIIRLGAAFNSTHVKGYRITAGGSASLVTIAQAAAQHELTGMESLAGIPGTIGAAVFMNAGAYGTNTLELVEKIRGVHSHGHAEEISHIESQYRQSFLPERFIVTAVTFALAQGNSADIKRQMQYFRTRRLAAQPIDTATAGCTFKNPEGNGAGRLIDRLGLKGHRLAGIQISEKHANFLINNGTGTPEQARQLIQKIHTAIYENYGVKLDLEIKIYNEDGTLWKPEVTE